MKKPFSLLPSDLLEKVRLYSLLSKDVEGYLSLPLHFQVNVVGMDDGSLKLLANNASLATMLRYQQSGLLDYLNKSYNLSLKSVQIKVNGSFR